MLLKEIKRLYKATIVSVEGILACFKHEAAFTSQTVYALVLIPTAIYFCATPIERILCISTVLLVMLTELLNSGIEAAIDRISDEIHPLSKLAKDYGSAAVFMAIMIFLVTWITVFWDKLF